MNLYKLLGYKGAVPFIVMAGLLFVVEDKAAVATIQMAYGCAILSFLAGVHWSHGLPRNNAKQVFLSMQPTILSMFALILAVVTGQYGVFMGLMAIGFPLVYVMDEKLLEHEWLPKDYFQFRKNITVVVTLALFASAIAFYI